MKTKLSQKLNLLQILEKECLFHNQSEKNLISLFAKTQVSSCPELFDKYKEYRINHLIETHKTSITYTVKNIENQVDLEFEKIKKRVELYILH
jgi:hypothetical protein